MAFSAALPSASALATAISFAALLIAALLGAIWLLVPRGTGRRWVGLAGLLPLLFAGRLVPSPDQLRITAFDIGLGSAVLVETGETFAEVKARRDEEIERAADRALAEEAA